MSSLNDFVNLEKGEEFEINFGNHEDGVSSWMRLFDDGGIFISPPGAKSPISFDGEDQERTLGNSRKVIGSVTLTASDDPLNFKMESFSEGDEVMHLTNARVRKILYVDSDTNTAMLSVPGSSLVPYVAKLKDLRRR